MNPETLLLRQVHPGFVQTDGITSQVFTPKRLNGVQLSVYDGEQISAEAAWAHYTGELQNKSIGVVAVTVSECESNGLIVRPDSKDFQEHVLIEFGQMGRGRIQAVANILRDAAKKRGWLYPESA